MPSGWSREDWASSNIIGIIRSRRDFKQRFAIADTGPVCDERALEAAVFRGKNGAQGQARFDVGDDLAFRGLSRQRRHWAGICRVSIENDADAG